MADQFMVDSRLEPPPLDAEGPQKGSPGWIILGLIIFVLVIAGLVFAVNAMIQHPGETETIRDIVIIFMAFESLIIGLVLILLIIQVARLTAMLQNEVRPILDATNETVRTLQGTSKFLSSKMISPVIKVNSSIAAVRRAIEIIVPGRFRKR